MSARRARIVALGALAAAVATVFTLANPAPLRADDPAASVLPPALRDVGIDRHVGGQLPLDVRLRDETGAEVRLGQYFGKKPVIVVPVYYNCPMLCPLALEGLARSLRMLTFGARTDYELVVFSFDPRDTAADARRKKADALATFGRAGGDAGWHFLTGDARAIAAMTRAIGFRYKAEGGQFVHASTLVMATPQGRIARYLYTTEPAPKDLRLAMVEASAGRLGTFADQVLLYCFHYDAMTGKYTLLTMRLVRIGGVLTVLALGAFIAFMLRQERRGRIAMNRPSRIEVST
ncbi:MAG TPA: SCO family protein [Thermoanaerobaculia bacterium]|nr:SCO family protein [Thermoanaerobaculia bacterium]